MDGKKDMVGTKFNFATLVCKKKKNKLKKNQKQFVK